MHAKNSQVPMYKGLAIDELPSEITETQAKLDAFKARPWYRIWSIEILLGSILMAWWLIPYFI